MSSRLTWCADERAEPDWIVVGMTIRMVMSDAEDRSLVRGRFLAIVKAMVG